MFRTAIFAAAIVAAAPALAQSEPVGDYAEVNGMRMYYEVSGKGEPIVVLPGAHMSIIQWARSSPCSPRPTRSTPSTGPESPKI